MAKNTDTHTVTTGHASTDGNFQFNTGRTVVMAKEPEDRYAAEVAWIIEQDSHLTDDEREQGIHNTVTVQVPSKPTLRKRTDKETGVQSTVETDTIARYKRYIQQSAHRQDRTADIIRTEEQNDDTALLTFLLKPAVKRPRKATLHAVESEQEQNTDAA